MLKMLLPKEAGFFNLFIDIGNLIVAGAKEFQLLLAAPPEGRDVHGQRLKQIEHEADNITHLTMTKLHSTFITPLDREDIHVLIKRLDDILDFMDAAAQRIVLYKIGPTPPDMRKLADINLASAELVLSAVSLLSNMKNSAELLRLSVDINRLENEADTVLRAAVAKLFSDEADTRQLIKLKEIYELLETVTDRCEDVANVIESIVIEYS